jgi:hypothetical protein
MRLLKKYSFAAILLLAPAISFATITIDNPLGSQSDVSDIIFDITVFAYELAFPFIALGTIWAGFIFVTAGGNEQSIKKAKSILIWSLAGGAILMLSSDLVALVSDLLQP